LILLENTLFGPCYLRCVMHYTSMLINKSKPTIPLRDQLRQLLLSFTSERLQYTVNRGQRFGFAWALISSRTKQSPP
jgi:hypothetical protein